MRLVRRLFAVLVRLRLRVGIRRRLVVVVEDVPLGALGRAVRLVPLEVRGGHLVFELVDRLLGGVLGAFLGLGGFAAEGFLRLGDDSGEGRVRLLVVQRGLVELPRLHELLERLVAEGELGQAEGDVASGFGTVRERRLGEAVDELVGERLRLAILVDEAEQSGHDALERGGLDGLVSGQAGEQIRQEVVDGVAVLAAQLVEEQARDGRYARIRVLQAPRHLRDVALHLHHVVEHEVRQHRDGVLSHPRVRVVQRVAPLLQTV